MALCLTCLLRLRQSNVFVEGVSHKIRRQIEDLERAGGVDSGALTVDGVPVDTYLTRSGLLLPASCPVQSADRIRMGGLLPQRVCSSKASLSARACRFVWDEGKYPTMSPLKEIVGSIQSQVAKIEDDMKVGLFLVIQL